MSEDVRGRIEIIEDDITRAHSITFPSISTGVYRFPLERATRIAIRVVMGFLRYNQSTERIFFACFGHNIGNAYRSILAENEPRTETPKTD